MTLLLGVLIASMVGSLHCAAMCGAFACAATRGQGSTIRAQGAYHAGRLVSYVILGIAAGVVGATVDDLGALAGLARGAAIVAGALMVLWALDTIGTHVGTRSFLPSAPESLKRLLGSLLQRTSSASTTVRSGALGLVTTLLPCGWLYAFVVTAGGTGRPLDGALVMLVFWAGTVPLLAGVGAGAARLIGPLGRRLTVVTATAVLVLGLLTMAGRLHPPGGSHARAEVVHAGH